jgi:hypothetical protein
MIGIHAKVLVAMLGAVAVMTTGPADARHRHRSAPVHTTSTSLPVDASGTPIIMQGYQSGSGRGRVIPQVGGPITVPPPHTGLPDLPARQLLQASPPPVYAAPSRPTFSDRVTNCIHSYALNAGVGNNPTNQTAYMGQCVNQ